VFDTLPTPAALAAGRARDCDLCQHSEPLAGVDWTRSGMLGKGECRRVGRCLPAQGATRVITPDVRCHAGNLAKPLPSIEVPATCGVAGMTFGGGLPGWRKPNSRGVARPAS